MPVLQSWRQIEVLENHRIPLRLALNTPLVSTLPRFADCAEALKLDPATAAILDDMRFLISAVLALPDKPSQKELRKINTTSAWIYNRTLALPDYSPRRGPPAPPPTLRSATAPSIIVTDIEAEDLATDTEQSSFWPRRASWHSVQSVHSTNSANSAASSDQAYSDQEGSEDNRLPKPTHTTFAASSSSPSFATSPEPPDYLYQSVRLAAIIYSRAVTQRQPFSSVVRSEDFSLLWSTMWRVPLGTWKGVLGVFNWIVAALAPVVVVMTTGQSQQRHGRFVKSMLANSLLQIGLDNWELARGVMEASGRLQEWLAGESQEGDGEGENQQRESVVS
jgi:hypothetical protein